MKQHGYIYLISCAALLALVCVFTRHIQGMDMQTIVFARALIAAIFIVGIIVVQRDWKALKLVDTPNTLIVGGAQSGTMLLFTGALLSTTAANAILLSYMGSSCFSLLFIKYTFKQDVPNRAFGNLLFSLIGLFLVAGPQDISLSSQQMMGNLMALGSGLSNAVMMVWSKPLSKKVTGSYIVFWQHVVATLALLPFATLSTNMLLPENVLPLIGLGVICTGLAFLLFVFGVRLVPSNHVLITPLLESLFTIGVAALLLQESLSSGAIIGAVLIVFGAYQITAVTSGSEPRVVKGRTPRRRYLAERAKLAFCFGGSLICMLITILTAYSIRTIDPVQSGEDHAALLLILLGLQSLLLLIVGGRAAERLRTMRHKTGFVPLKKTVQPVRQYPIPEFIPSRTHSSWSLAELEQPALYENVSYLLHKQR